MAALFQVSPPFRGFAFGIGRDFSKVFPGLSSDIRQFALAPRERLDPLDEVGSLAVGLLEQSRKGQGDQLLLVFAEPLRELADQRFASLCTDVTRRNRFDQRGDPGFLPPVL